MLTAGGSILAGGDLFSQGGLLLLRRSSVAGGGPIVAGRSAEGYLLLGEGSIVVGCQRVY